MIFPGNASYAITPGFVVPEDPFDHPFSFCPPSFSIHRCTSAEVPSCADPPESSGLPIQTLND